MTLRGIDTNLVVALHALLHERSVTRAARRVGVGQSAMSHALARLRLQLGDPLLVPAGRVLVLTERARGLVETVDLAVAQLERVFHPGASFDPATSAQVFHIAATDNLELYLLPRLTRLLADEAPGVSLRLRHLGADWAAALQRGDIDLKLGRSYAAAPGLHSQDLLRERLVAVLRADHPDRDALTLARYAALGHVVVTPGAAGRSLVDERLADAGLARRVAVTVPHFLVAPFIVADSDHVLTVPERLALRFTALGLHIAPLPIDLPDYSLGQVWAARTDLDPAQRWLRDAVTRACEPSTASMTGVTSIDSTPGAGPRYTAA